MGRSGRRLATIIAAAVAVTAVLWWLAQAGYLPRPGPAVPAAQSVPRPGDAFALTVDYVFDGDTIEATALAPTAVVRDTRPVRVRLIGIDTPEGTPTPDCWADEARSHLRRLLPEGARVWAATDRDWYDNYGRVLAYLWTDDGVFLNHALVAAGDAEAIRIRPNDLHYPLLRQAQADAQAAGRGQWGACP